MAEHDRISTLSADDLLPLLGLNHHLPSAWHLPLSESLNSTFFPFEESPLERAHQSGSFPLPFCFSQCPSQGWYWGIFPQTHILSRRRRLFCSALQNFLPGIPLPFCNTSSFPTCRTCSRTLPQEASPPAMSDRELPVPQLRDGQFLL